MSVAQPGTYWTGGERNKVPYRTSPGRPWLRANAALPGSGGGRHPWLGESVPRVTSPLYAIILYYRQPYGQPSG